MTCHTHNPLQRNCAHHIVSGDFINSQTLKTLVLMLLKMACRPQDSLVPAATLRRNKSHIHMRPELKLLKTQARCHQPPAARGVCTAALNAANTGREAIRLALYLTEPYHIDGGAFMACIAAAASRRQHGACVCGTMTRTSQMRTDTSVACTTAATSRR